MQRGNKWVLKSGRSHMKRRICLCRSKSVSDVTTYNVLLQIRYVTLWSWPSTVWNWTFVSVVTWPNCTPNIEEIEQSVAELLWFQFVKVDTVRHLGFVRKAIFTILRPLGTYNAPACQILTQSGNERLSCWWFAHFPRPCFRKTLLTTTSQRGVDRWRTWANDERLQRWKRFQIAAKRRVGTKKGAKFRIFDQV